MKLCMIGALLSILLIAESVDIKTDAGTPPPTAPESMLSLMFPYRREKKNYNSMVSPCGNSTKGKAHGMYNPSKYITLGIRASQDNGNMNCTIRLGTGIDIEESFMVLKPINVPNVEGVFKCGHSNKSTEQVVAKLPEDFQCDNCTLQLVWETDKGPRYQCSDIIIYEKGLLDCADKCQNNGICINGKCSCTEAFHGDFCDIRRSTGSIFTWKLGLVLITLLGLCLLIWAVILYLRDRIARNRLNPPSKGKGAGAAEAPSLSQAYDNTQHKSAGEIQKDTPYEKDYGQN